MNIERGPRKQRGFTILDNSLLQNTTLSFGARGLAGYVLSLPPGAQVDIRTLAETNPEGRQAIAGFMKELEETRYLVRTTVRGERGRFHTTTTLYEEPQAEELIPQSAAKPWSRVKERREAETAEGASSQVAPKPVSPYFGGPGPGRPESGETGSTPYGVKKPGERTSPQPPVIELAAAVPAQGGGGKAAPDEQDAAAFVDGLPYAGRLLGRKTREHLVGQVAEAFRAGWTSAALRRQLTNGTAGAKSLAAVYRYRLDELPDPATATAVRAAEETPTPTAYLPEPARAVIPREDGVRRTRAALHAAKADQK